MISEPTRSDPFSGRPLHDDGSGLQPLRKGARRGAHDASGRTSSTRIATMLIPIAALAPLLAVLLTWAVRPGAVSRRSTPVTAVQLDRSSATGTLPATSDPASTTAPPAPSQSVPATTVPFPTTTYPATLPQTTVSPVTTTRPATAASSPAPATTTNPRGRVRPPLTWPPHR